MDRLWPRGLIREKAHVDLLFKHIAPSTEMRKQYCLDDTEWPRFKRGYIRELKDKGDQIKELLDKAGSRRITLLYASKDIVALNEM